jgi:hypothetical protein
VQAELGAVHWQLPAVLMITITMVPEVPEPALLRSNMFHMTQGEARIAAKRVLPPADEVRPWTDFQRWLDRHGYVSLTNTPQDAPNWLYQEYASERN